MAKKALWENNDKLPDGDINGWKPLQNLESQRVRRLYRQAVRKMGIPAISLGSHRVHAKSGSVVAKDYTRVVVGDYGAYIEMSPQQVLTENLREKFPGKRREGIKYIWLVVNDHSRTKVYRQVRTVDYADYRVGMYYVSVNDVDLVENEEG